MSTATERLARLAERRHGDGRIGITSVCSAHPVVIEVALAHGLATGADVLIEATCNQVNQSGGYTGMTPADFRRFVEGIAGRLGFPAERLILGGDHLGPNPWKSLPAEAAMARAEAMIAAYAAAGFTKLHLDASMGCAGEPAALPDAVVSERAARLAAAAERARRDAAPAPVYVVGTEVPVPGGALEALDHIVPTTPGDARQTVEVHRGAFERMGVGAAFARVIGAVVQPGVEFGNAEVAVYERARARDLSASLEHMPGLVFEAHSTDYQPREALRALVEDGFAILKVGPGLTFALREALYGLSAIAAVLRPGALAEPLPAVMERLMLAQPEDWARYYEGEAAGLHLQRHYSFSDRIRYYWTRPEAGAAVDALLAALGDAPIPAPLVGQFLGAAMPDVAAGRVRPTAPALLRRHVARVLDDYDHACVRY